MPGVADGGVENLSILLASARGNQRLRGLGPPTGPDLFKYLTVY